MKINADQTKEGTQIKHGGMNADHADERRSNRGASADHADERRSKMAACQKRMSKRENQRMSSSIHVSFEQRAGAADTTYDKQSEREERARSAVVSKREMIYRALPLGLV